MTKIGMFLRVTLAGLTVGALADARAGEPIQTEATMIARGTFDVQVTPQPQDDSAGGAFGRLFLDKQFHGGLEAGSRGQMLAAMTAVKDSGGYVAMELVTGALNGKRGSFILQHKGTMRKGAYVMEVTVVPDSGTDELAGIAGAMTITIDGTKHCYEFEYSLVGATD